MSDIDPIIAQKERTIVALLRAIEDLAGRVREGGPEQVVLYGKAARRLAQAYQDIDLDEDDNDDFDFDED